MASRERYPALDGLRGVAILLVLMFHFGWAKPPVGHPAKLLVFLTNFGWTGVDLFFVLSGFLITGILLDSKNDSRIFPEFLRPARSPHLPAVLWDPRCHAGHSTSRRLV